MEVRKRNENGFPPQKPLLIAMFFLTSQLWKFPIKTVLSFKDPLGSAPCSYSPGTGPYPKPDEFSSFLYFSNITLTLITLTFHLNVCLPSDVFF
jgi:hypothetical protein